MAYKETDSCLVKVAPDEPIFVLRAQDRTAPRVVRYWADRLCAILHQRPGDHATTLCPSPKVQEALRCAEEMEQWPTRKTPD